jgi:UPF0755 protein
MRSIAANAITLVIVIGIVIAGAVGVSQRLFVAKGPLEAETVFVVERGASLDRIADDLAAAGVIDNATLFRIGARYADRADGLRFGEYRVPAGASMAEVLEILSSGRVIQYSVTIPEGLTSWEIVALLRDESVLTGELADVPAEGSLAPETYSVSRGDSRAGLVARMQARQSRLLEEAWAARDPSITLESPEAALVLASIIEKETAVADERRRVSAVFHNRLRDGIRLQSDPTIIYGITEGQGPARSRDPAQRHQRTDALEHLRDPRPSADADRQSGPRVDLRGDATARNRRVLLRGRWRGRTRLCENARRAQPQRRALAGHRTRPRRRMTAPASDPGGS